MRKQLLIIALTGLALSSLIAQQVQQNELPQAVQKALGNVKGADTVKDIEKQVKDGMTVYEVEFDRRGFNPKVWIAENGAIIQDSRKPGAVGAPERQPQTGIGAASRDLKVSDLPKAVQGQIKARDDLSNVKRIQQTTQNGRIVYDVECEKDGTVSKLRIASDGTVLKDQ